MTSNLTPALAAEHRADLLAAAAQRRLARSARTSGPVQTTWIERVAVALRRPRLAMG